MIYLLIDNSNSRTKLSLADTDELKGDLVRIDTPEVSEETLAEATKGWQFDAVMLCSVVPQKEELIERFFLDYPFHSLGHESDHGITISVDRPMEVGADRIANVIGVSSLCELPAVVVDFGTAVTFDIVDEGGVYLGGSIAPGLNSMNEYLSKKTALLPQIQIKEPQNVIGKSTVEAMLSGAVYGYRGLIRGILQAIEQELGRNPLVVSTGGDGMLIAEGVSEIDTFFNQITLEGLRVAAVRRFCREV